MSMPLQRMLVTSLLVIHGGLLAWAIVGMAELGLEVVPWSRISNPAFPAWLLLMHWAAVSVGASAFLLGYRTRSPSTPAVVAVSYSFMALVCVIETFGFLEGIGRFVAMTAEFITYICIALLLRHLPLFVQRFRGTG